MKSAGRQSAGLESTSQGLCLRPRPFAAPRAHAQAGGMASEGQEELFVVRFADPQLADTIRRMLREDESPVEIQLDFPGKRDRRSAKRRSRADCSLPESWKSLWCRCGSAGDDQSGRLAAARDPGRHAHRG